MRYTSFNYLYCVCRVSVGWPRRRPLTVAFKDVSLTIDKTTILSRVGGACRPGEVLAIMGPSGKCHRCVTITDCILNELRPMKKGFCFINFGLHLS